MNSYALTGIGIAVSFFALYAGYYAINHLGLGTTSASATVLEKQYTPPGETYRTTIVNNQSVVQPASTAEIYAVVYEVDGEKLLGVHDQSLYDRLEIGDEVIVTLQTTRITKHTLVVGVQ